MKYRTRTVLALSLVSSLALAGACSDAGTTGTTGTGGGAAASGSIDVTIGGEQLATAGIPWDPKGVAHVTDGWEVKFEHVIVTTDKITVAENPDKVPSDQSQTGTIVAEVTGPWAVDLHKTGPLPGAGGEGTAFPITTITTQNKNGDKPFEADQRYAFSYDTVVATDKAKKVNFEGDAETEALYAEMVQKGYSALYVGTATFKGTDCTSSDPAYDFTKVPTTVKFHLGFTTPVSSINCQNQSNQGDAFPNEEYQRGIPILANKASGAQLMYHMDHPFYTDVAHEPALFFDQMAAQLVGKPDGAVVTMDDLTKLDPTAFVDGAGKPLPWRICDGSMLPASKQMGFETGSISVNPASTPDKAFRDYRDYIHYVHSTQEHLNGGEGLCYTKRNYPAPQ
jgi:hypothetical protein